jgi:hypothetical protein
MYTHDIIHKCTIFYMHIYANYEISFFRLFGGTKRNKKKILLGFVKHTLVKF